jgi:TonB family protein
MKIMPLWLLLLFSFLLYFPQHVDAAEKSQKAALIFKTQIGYPVEARERRMEGSGTYRLDIDKRGYVTSVRVGASSGHKLLDQAAIKGLLKCRFKAGTVPLVRIPVTWLLPDRVFCQATARG